MIHVEVKEIKVNPVLISLNSPRANPGQRSIPAFVGPVGNSGHPEITFFSLVEFRCFIEDG